MRLIEPKKGYPEMIDCYRHKEVKRKVEDESFTNKIKLH